MTRSPLRVWLAEGAALVGVAFGAWLIHNAFPLNTDTPNLALLVLGAIDILLCFALLAYFLRQRLREAEPLPGRWIIGGAVVLAGFLGWIAALFIDSERLLAEEQHHREFSQELTKLEDTLRHVSDAVNANWDVDRHVWELNHDEYARLHDQLQAALRARPPWDNDLVRLDDQVRLMEKAYQALLVEILPEQRFKLRGDFQLARDRAVEQSELLRSKITQSETDVTAQRRARWHGVGAAALTGVIVTLGCLLLWLIFDRELRRSWKARARLAQSEQRFRSLIENHGEPMAVLDGTACMAYVSPAWKDAFNLDPEDLLGTPLLDLIHADDRARVLSALQSRIAQAAVPCRLSADYGVWHDVEMQCQPHAEENSLVVRFHDVRETPEFVPVVHHVEPPAQDVVPLQQLQDAKTQIAELEKRCEALRDKEQVVRTDLDHHKWLLGSHKDAGGEGTLILSTQGQVLSWNPAFVQLWKLSEDTLSGHTWLTIAAHMETLAKSGWDDFRRAASVVAPSQASTVAPSQTSVVARSQTAVVARSQTAAVVARLKLHGGTVSDLRCGTVSDRPLWHGLRPCHQRSRAIPAGK